MCLGIDISLPLIFHVRSTGQFDVELMFLLFNETSKIITSDQLFSLSQCRYTNPASRLNNFPLPNLCI